jgi:hypothetical protein
MAGMARITILQTAFLNKRATAALLLIIASCFIAHATESDSWQRLPSGNQFRNLINLPAVPKTKIYEVVPTKVETALAWHLASVPFAVLTCEDADFLTGGHYSCDEKAKPILVRAVYANGGTGNFTVRYDGKILFVHHGSLGDPGSVRNLPLIVCLPFVPVELFAWTSSAR